MAKKAPNNDSFADLQFPLSGIDLTTEFEEQRTGTTQEGVNVRAFEPITNRGRGGQRAGLGKYIPHTVGLIDENGDDAPPNVIQHLAIIVDPTVEGLLSDDDELGGPNRVNDPSTSNRRRRIPIGQTRTVRRGGSGGQTNLKQPRPTLIITATDQTKNQGDVFTFTGTEFSASGLGIIDSLTTATLRSAGAKASAAEGQYPITIKNVQGSVAGDGSGTAGLKKKYKISYVRGVMTVGSNDRFIEAAGGFNGSPNPGLPLVGEIPLTLLDTGDLIVLFIINRNVGGYSFSSTMGNSFLEIGTPVPLDASFDYKMWSGISVGSGSETITITLDDMGGSEQFDAISLVFRGFDVSPLDSSAQNSGTGTSWSTGSISATDPTEMILSCFAHFSTGSVQTIVSPPAMTFLMQVGIASAVFDICRIFPTAVPANPTLSSSISQPWAAKGASFKSP